MSLAKLQVFASHSGLNFEFVLLTFSRSKPTEYPPAGRRVYPILDPRLGNVKVAFRSTFTFRSLYVANKKTAERRFFVISTYCVFAEDAFLVNHQ